VGIAMVSKYDTDYLTHSFLKQIVV
jgi:hypothetical protein